VAGTGARRNLVYAGYNDAIAYAELVVVELGRLVRHYLQDEQDPSQDSDFGQLPEEARQRFESWIDVMSWIEEDEDKLQRPEQGGSGSTRPSRVSRT
jgi:hypothetical protein